MHWLGAAERPSPPTSSPWPAVRDEQYAPDMRWLHRSGAVLVLFFGGCASDGERCTAAAVQRALDDAAPGDVVTIGACTVEGSLRVPEGVTLAGAGRDRTTVHGPSDTPAVTLAPSPSGPVTSVRDLTVTVDAPGGLGVAVRGAGEVRISGLRVAVERGGGILLRAFGSVEIADSEVVGPVTADNASDPAFDAIDAVPATVATLGIVALEGERLDCRGVSTRGMAAFGTVVIGVESVAWEGGAITGNLRVGFYGADGAFDLRGLEIGDTHVPATGLEASAAAVFVESASATTVTTSALTVSRNEEYGLLHYGVAAQHTDLTAEENLDVAVWSGGGELAVLGSAGGPGSRLENNRIAGLVVVAAPSLRVERTTIARTRELPSFVRPNGDGLQVLESTGVVIADCVLSDNARAGLVLEGGAGTTTLNALTVELGGGQAGALAGRRDADDPSMLRLTGIVSPGLVRDAPAQAVDEVFMGTLRVLASPGQTHAISATGVDVADPGDVIAGVGPCD